MTDIIINDNNILLALEAKNTLHSILEEIKANFYALGSLINLSQKQRLAIILEVIRGHVTFENSFELYNESHPTIVLENYIKDKIASTKINNELSDKELLLLLIEYLKLQAAGLLPDPAISNSTILNTTHDLDHAKIMLINAKYTLVNILQKLDTDIKNILVIHQITPYSQLALRELYLTTILDIVKEHVILESSEELYHELHPTIVLEDYLRDSLTNQPKEVPSMKAIILKAIHILKLEAAGSLKDSDYCEDPIKCFDILIQAYKKEFAVVGHSSPT